MKIALTLARLLLGGVFLLSGILKLLSPVQAYEFLSRVTSFNLGLSRTLVILFCCFEIGIAALLFIGNRFLAIASLISSSLLLLFTFAGLLSTESDISCGCFGELLNEKIDEYFLVRNFLLLGVSLFILKASTSIITKPNLRDNK